MDSSKLGFGINFLAQKPTFDPHSNVTFCFKGGTQVWYNLRKVFNLGPLFQISLANLEFSLVKKKYVPED